MLTLGPGDETNGEHVAVLHVGVAAVVAVLHVRVEVDVEHGDEDVLEVEVDGDWKKRFLRGASDGFMFAQFNQVGPSPFLPR